MLALSEVLSQRWGIHATSERLLQADNSRRITRIEARQGAFVAKELPASEELVGSMSVLAALNDQGFRHAPRLVPTTTGESVHLADRAIYLMEAVDGTPPPGEPLMQQEIGRVTRVLNDVTGVQHRRPRLDAVIADLLQRDTRLQLGPEYRRLVSGLAVLNDQPLAVVHGEINRANSRLTAEGTLVLLDWDDVGLGVRWLDAGYPLIQTYLAEDLSFDAAGAAAYYRGYSGGVGWGDHEWQLIFTAAVLHALRYLPWGDTGARWRRLLHAVAQERELIEAARAQQLSTR